MRLRGTRLVGAVVAAMLVFVVSNAAATVIGMAADQWRNPVWWVAAGVVTLATALVGVLLPGGKAPEPAPAPAPGGPPVAHAPGGPAGPYQGPGGPAGPYQGPGAAPPAGGYVPQPAAPVTARPRARRTVSLVAALAVVLGLCGAGTAGGVVGVRYLAGWLTGSETGQQRLVEPVTATSGYLRLTVTGVEVTRHYTKIDLSATNDGPESLRLNKQSCTLTFADGATAGASAFLGSWPETVPPGTPVRGVLLFSTGPGPGPTTATLSFATIFSQDFDAPTSISVSSIQIAAA